MDTIIEQQAAITDDVQTIMREVLAKGLMFRPEFDHVMVPDLRDLINRVVDHQIGQLLDAGYVISPSASHTPSAD